MSPTDSPPSLAEQNTRVIQSATTLLNKALAAGVSGQYQLHISLAHRLLDLLDKAPDLSNLPRNDSLIRDITHLPRTTNAHIWLPEQVADQLLETNIRIVAQALEKCMPDGVAVHTPQVRLDAAERFLAAFHRHTANSLADIAKLQAEQNNRTPY